MARLGLGLLPVFLLVCAACGDAHTSRTGRTVVFHGAGSFPPTTIVGAYSPRACRADARTVADDARSYYAHTHGAPGPADLYYYELRFAYAHFQADGCASEQLGQALRQGLSEKQRRFLLHNVTAALAQAFQTALAAD